MDSGGIGRLNDDELAALARTDRAAFGELYERLVEPIYGYCLRRVHDRQAAEDLTSVVFTKAMLAIGSFRPEAGPFRAWLFTIARNALIDDRRAFKPTLSIESALNGHAAANAIEDDAIASESLRELRRLLDTLTPDQREVIEFRLAGLTDIEIARVIGRSRGSVRVLQHRAIKRLRSAIVAEIKD